MSSIKTTIECEYLAPIERLKADINSSSLKFAIFANNGSGKTYLSRAFRLLEKNNAPITKVDGKIPTDKMISFGKRSCSFAFKIIDSTNNIIKEDIKLNIESGVIPTIPSSYYLYHCFNDDYVEENVQEVHFDKNGNISGYILGKENIDVTNEEAKLSSTEKERNALIEKVKNEVDEYIAEKIGSIPNIRRLEEYTYLNFDEIKASLEELWPNITKTYDQLINDYDKIKSLPENLSDIQTIKPFEDNSEISSSIIQLLETEYSLSSFADEFKRKIKSKQTFIEEGLKLLNDDKICPFCEQKLTEKALQLIDIYNTYVENEEAKIVKELRSLKDGINLIFSSIDKLSAETNARIITYNNYKSKYIPSLENTNLESISIKELSELSEIIVNSIEKKIASIDTAIFLDKPTLEDFENQISLVNEIIKRNNEKINLINSKKKYIGEENRNVRRDLCKVVFNDLISNCKKDLQNIITYDKEIEKLVEDIRIKREKQKVDRKEKVANTIKRVLKYFFDDKYTLDKETFRLAINEKTLQNGQAKEVLSAGEKNVIAFAFYLGDIHLKVDKEDDYSRIFFIIDDPISSMDFNHVYSLSGAIRNLKEFINNEKERFIILTHNMEFMRILVGNKISSKNLILKNNGINEFNQNMTVPYLSHLIDIYHVAQKKIKPNHTTANSIRHIVETLVKFENVHSSEDSIAKFIKDNIPDNIKTFTLINDLSHGGWRNEQAPISEDDFIEVCSVLIDLINKRYNGQIAYCTTLTKV